MKEKIIEIIERFKDIPYKKGDFILTHSWVVNVATELETLVNQEVEKRIAERMPSDELIEEIQEKSLLEYENAPICEIDYYSGFQDGVVWLRSRLTTPRVNDSQKTEGGGE